MAIRGLQHRDLRADALETHHAVHPTALDRSLALQLESELDEERRRGGEIVDHDAHVIHALDRHAINRSGTTNPGPQPITRTWPADLMVLDRAAPSPAQSYGE